MTERTPVAKKIEAKAEAPSSRVQKAEHPLSMNSPFEQILFLQRTAGNQAVQKLIKKRALQAKLKTSQNDMHEQEADKVAEQVTEVPDSIIQKQTNPEEEKEEIVQTKPFVNHEIPLIQRQAEEEKEEEPVQRKEANKTLDISPDVHTIINSLQGRGHPLPDQVRGYFEPRFGQDFGNVHVHTDSNAVLAAQAINAKAFTVGHDVVFGAGQYAPDTIEGKRLLGHELTHVIQQRGKRNSINTKEESDENLSWWEKAKKWAFEKTLDAAGVPKEQMMGIIKKAGSAIREIFEKPGRFLGTLIKAVGQGFTQFKDRIGEHLKAGFMGWLFGTMAKAGLELPKDFSLKSILTMVLQVLGISANFIRQKFVKLIGEKNVKRFEKAWQVLSTLMSQGIGGLWNMLKEHLGNLKEMVVDQTRNWVITEIIKSAVMKIVSMFNPVSGLITIIKTIYNVIKFLIERAGQIKGLFTAIIESVVELAMGSISSAANKIEQALARLIPIAIGFLASLLGIGGITDKIKEIIKRISSTVDKAIDKVLEKAVKPFAKKLKGFFEKGKEKVIGAGKAIAQAGLPKDPKERVKLAAKAAVSAARKLTGRVTQALLTPVLSIIKVRYGLKDIQPYVKGGTWWVKATINPESEEDTGVSSAKADREPDKVREIASKTLEHELSGVHSIKEAQTIIGQVAKQLKPEGLKGLEIGPELSEGVLPIYDKAIKIEPLGYLIAEYLKYKGVPTDVSVRTAAEIKLESEHGSGEEAKSKNQRVVEFIEPSHPPYKTAKQRKYGGIKWGTSTKLQFLTWNINVDKKGFNSKNAEDHAEDQLINELYRMNDKDKIFSKMVEIRIQNFNKSPCDRCCSYLNDMLKKIHSVQEGNPKLKIAEIYWQELYNRGNTNAKQTTWKGIQELTKGRGWIIHATPDALPEKTGIDENDPDYNALGEVSKRFIWAKKNHIGVDPEQKLTDS